MRALGTRVQKEPGFWVPQKEPGFWGKGTWILGPKKEPGLGAHKRNPDFGP